MESSSLIHVDIPGFDFDADKAALPVSIRFIFFKCSNKIILNLEMSGLLLNTQKIIIKDEFLVTIKVQKHWILHYP